MITLKLYGTSHCHLCEQASDVIESFIPFARNPVEVVHIDIVDDDILYEELEQKIPVVENVQTGARLYWPFQSSELIRIC